MYEFRRIKKGFFEIRILKGEKSIKLIDII